nr:MAG TPA: hypothetical protein [Caudoviricetes sp.]
MERQAVTHNSVAFHAPWKDNHERWPRPFFHRDT